MSLSRAFSRLLGRGFGALAKVSWKTTNLCLREHIVLVRELLGAHLFKIAAPEFAEVVSWRKFFQPASLSTERQTVRNQLGNGSRKTTSSRIIPTKMANQAGRL